MIATLHSSPTVAKNWLVACSVFFNTTTQLKDMSVASFNTHHDHTIRYQIQVSPEQVKLRFWEPQVISGSPSDQPLPYLYLANCTFRTVAEAETYLRNHLLDNGAFDVPDSNFPEEGAIEILPYPTWGVE